MKYNPDLNRKTKRENAIIHTTGFRVIEAIFFLSASLALGTFIALGYYMAVILVGVGACV
jgi:hypothetical protein